MDDRFINALREQVLARFTQSSSGSSSGRNTPEAVITQAVSTQGTDISRLFDTLELPFDEKALENHLKAGGTLEDFMQPILDQAAQFLLNPEKTAPNENVIKAIGLANYAQMVRGAVSEEEGGGNVIKAPKQSHEDFSQREKEVAKSLLIGVALRYGHNFEYKETPEQQRFREINASLGDLKSAIESRMRNEIKMSLMEKIPPVSEKDSGLRKKFLISSLLSRKKEKGKEEDSKKAKRELSEEEKDKITQATNKKMAGIMQGNREALSKRDAISVSTLDDFNTQVRALAEDKKDIETMPLEKLTNYHLNALALYLEKDDLQGFFLDQAKTFTEGLPMLFSIYTLGLTTSNDLPLSQPLFSPTHDIDSIEIEFELEPEDVPRDETEKKIDSSFESGEEQKKEKPITNTASSSRPLALDEGKLKRVGEMNRDMKATMQEIRKEHGVEKKGGKPDEKSENEYKY